VGISFGPVLVASCVDVVVVDVTGGVVVVAVEPVNWAQYR
jgi:hypothetical protein